MSCPLNAILNDSDKDPVHPSNTPQELCPPPGASTRTPYTVPPTTVSPKDESGNHPEPTVSPSPVETSLEASHEASPTQNKPDIAATRPESDPTNPDVDHQNNGIFNRLLHFPELMFEMVSHLDADDLLALFSMSYNFHLLASSRFTTMILSQARAKAPESAYIFPFRCYSNLCLRDPALRRNEARADFHVRHVPGFQWLKMILFREHVVNGIVACLEKEGLMLPAATTITIKKIWFFMDLSTNERRDALIRNTDYWTEGDLYLAHLFIMKLDMLLICPMTGDGDLGLRQMLLGQRSLSTLWRILRREEMRDTFEMMQMIVAWNYQRSDAQLELDEPIFDVPADKIGMLQYEGWGQNPDELFHQFDEVLVWESVRRRLDAPAHYLDMILYGFIDMNTGLDIWTKDQRRKQEEDLEKEARGEVLVADNNHDDNDE
ncbi:MAG: hypothetical protein Q9168_002813 [Polycauliona sp. 1 TL-2023]